MTPDQKAADIDAQFDDINRKIDEFSQRFEAHLDKMSEAVARIKRITRASK